ncbi:MAG: response regulator transcription factor [Actinobacteria bacterium]|nr:MAG: response regulator transcription factor [Actinomycetota bacterium]
MEIEILIVDDHGLVREGLRALLEAEDDLRVVGEARTGGEALALTRHLRPDMVVLDVRLPDRNGIEICAEIHDLSPATRVLVCSGLADGSALVEAAKAGAEGFVSKEASNAEIVDAVRRVAGGASVVGEGSAQTMFRYLRSHRADAPRLAQLSGREREILGLLSEGLTNREIGTRLFISEKTVRNHVSGLLRKLHLRHRTEAALFAAPLRSELLPDE